MLSFTHLTAHLEKSLLEGSFARTIDDLLEKGLSLSHIINKDSGDTLLHFIVAHGSLKLINTVLEDASYDEINGVNASGETPLIQAVKSRHQLVTHLLINYQADPKKQDKEGKCALDYCDSQIKCTTKIMWHLIECADELASISDDDSFLKALNAMQSKRINLANPVDAADNSLFHLIVQHGSLRVINLILNYVDTQVLNIKNSQGDTPLHQTCRDSFLVKTQLLLEKGASSSIANNKGITPDSLMRDNEKFLALLKTQKRKTQDYITTIEALKKSIADNSTTRIIISLLKQGYTLEEPIDHLDNTFLHWLAMYAPFHMIEEVLEKSKITNIDTQNSIGETPLLIAARLGRQKAVSFLLANGANPTIQDISQRSAVEWAQRANDPIELTTKALTTEQTLYERLVSMFEEDVAVLGAMSEIEKVEYLFQKFITFIRSNHWLYDGTQRNYSQPFLLDCDAHRQYVVNCFDLAQTFATLLQALEISDVSTFVYKDMKSKSFLSKDQKIKGEFCCFDKEVQEKSFPEGYFNYDNHCVTTCQGMYFDPTFCCYYSHVDDIVDSYSKDEKNLSNPTKEKDNHQKMKDAIRIYANIGLTSQLKNLHLQNTPAFGQQKTFQGLFSCKFLAFLQSLFPETKWYTLNRVDKITFTSKNGNNYFSIELENNEVSFITENIPLETISDILVAWGKSLPSFDPILIIEANRNELGISIKDQLIQKGIGKNDVIFNPTEESPKPTATNKRYVKVKRITLK